MISAPSARAIEVGDPAPQCESAPISDTGPRERREFRGSLHLVDFWASWCTPCALSFRFMNELERDLHARGVEILAINVDEQAEDRRAFLAERPARFPIAADGDCALAFGVGAMPVSYLIDAEAVVRRSSVGFRPGEAAELREEIEALLARSPVSR
jgi:peroxiredoxin